MGVAVHYRTIAPVDAPVRAAMDQVAADCAEDWWCENLGFWDAPDGGVEGSTKLFRLNAMTGEGVVEDVDPGEDTVMAWNDCRRIVSTLATLSRQHGVTWRLTMEGMPLGHVTPAGTDDELHDSMWHFLDSSGLEVGEDEVAALTARIWRKFPPEQ